jgi:hypothetical protein
MDKTLVFEDIQIAYAKTLDSIFSKWVHDDDGANNYFQCQVKKTKKMNSVQLIYQPIGSPDDYLDTACVLIVPTKECGVKFTEEVFQEAKPYLDKVEEKLIDSINIFITKYGGWMESFGSKSFKDILRILEPLHLEKGKLKMKYEIKNFFSGPTMRWRPVDLVSWMYSLPAYHRYRTPKLEKNINVLNENIEKSNETIKDLEEELEVAFNQLHNLSIVENIQKWKEHIEYIQNRIEKYQKEIHSECDISVLRDVKYDYDEAIYEDWFSGHGDYQTAAILYKEAFPDRNPIVLRLSLSGMKRKLDE